MKGFANTTSDKRKYPLRLIIERNILLRSFGKYNVYGNRLECGHVVREASDLYGVVNWTKSQRCRQCYENLLTPSAHDDKKK